MLSERQLEALLKVFNARMQRVNDQYLQLMGEHLKMIGELTPSDVHRLTQLKQMRGNIRQIKRSIAKAAGASEADVEKVFEAAAESNERFMRAYYAEAQEPIRGQMGRSEPLERILKAQLRITEQEMRNLSRTTVVDSAYKNVVDIAVQAVQSGLADYKSAIRSAMAAAGKSGLRVQYASGATRRLDSAMRQNVLDGVRSLNNDVLRQLGKEYGADGIEISAHALCAEDHLPYQGRQFTIKQFNDIQTRLDRPFGMWNCKHTIFPIILGVSAQALDDETLKKYHRLSAEQVTIDDETLSRYEWSQEQRKIETAVRAQKDVATLAEASGDMKAVRAAQANIDKLMDYYDKISEESGIKQEYGRMAVQGYGYSGLKNTPKYDIISTETGAVYRRILDESGHEKYRYLQTDTIQKLDSSQAIAKHFQYRDEWGDTKEPIDETFSSLKLETQKEAAEGIEWARTTFGLKKLPVKIQTARLGTGTIGEYREGSRTLSFRKSLKTEEAFSTAVHEMTHFAEQISGLQAQEIVDQARKNLGLKAGSRKYSNQCAEIVGYDSRAVNDVHELLAYSVELYATKRANPLAAEISRIWLERMAKR